MPLLNFQSRFAPLVESGEKRQTIRAHRKDGRDPKVGDRLFLYTGARTKECRKLGESGCVRAERIEIGSKGSIVLGFAGRFPVTLNERSRERFARADGFESWTELVGWFEATHGLPFRGLLIEWDEIEREG